MLSASMKILSLIQQIISPLGNTVMILIQYLWLKNTMILISIAFIKKHEHQVSLMHNSLQFLTQLKTIKLEFSRRKKSRDIYSTNQDVVVLFINKLQEANDFRNSL